jgi:hypothetical protein
MTGRGALYALLGLFIVGILVYIVLSTKDSPQAPPPVEESFTAIERYAIENPGVLSGQVDRVIQNLANVKDYMRTPAAILDEVQSFPTNTSLTGFTQATLDAANAMYNKLTPEAVASLLERAQQVRQAATALVPLEQNLNALRTKTNVRIFEISPRIVNDVINIEMRFSTMYESGVSYLRTEQKYSLSNNLTTYDIFNVSLNSASLRAYLLDLIKDEYVDTNRLKSLRIATTDIPKYLSKSITGNYNTNGTINKMDSLRLSTNDMTNINIKISNTWSLDTLFYIDTNEQEVVDNVPSYPLRHINGKYVYVSSSGKLQLESTKSPAVLSVIIRDINVASQISEIYINKVKRPILLSVDANNNVSLASNSSLAQTHVIDFGLIKYGSKIVRNTITVDNYRTTPQYSTIKFVDIPKDSFMNANMSVQTNKFILKQINVTTSSPVQITQSIIQNADILIDRCNKVYFSIFYKDTIGSKGLCGKFVNDVNKIRLRILSPSEYMKMNINRLFISYLSYINITIEEAIKKPASERLDLKTQFLGSISGTLPERDMKIIDIFVDPSKYASEVSASQIFIMDNTNMQAKINSITGPNISDSSILIDGTVVPRNTSTGKTGRFSQIDITLDRKYSISYIVVVGSSNQPQTGNNVFFETTLSSDSKVVFSSITTSSLAATNVIRICDMDPTVATVETKGFKPDSPLDMYVSFCANVPNTLRPPAGAFENYGTQRLTVAGRLVDAPIIGSYSTAATNDLQRSLDLCSRLHLSNPPPKRRIESDPNPPNLYRYYRDGVAVYTYVQYPLPPGAERIQIYGGNGENTEKHRFIVTDDSGRDINTGIEMLVNIGNPPKDPLPLKTTKSDENPPPYEDYLNESMRVSISEPIKYYIPNRADAICYIGLRQEIFRGQFINVEDPYNYGITDVNYYYPIEYKDLPRHEFNKKFKNDLNCNTEFTGDVMQYLPSKTRQIVAEFFYNRHRRMLEYVYRAESTSVVESKKAGVKMMAAAAPFDYQKTVILDSIAQQFYEMLGGRYTMTYIYDISTVGTSQFDLRFDVAKHAYSLDIEEKIRVLTTDYKKNLTDSTTPLTANMVADLREKYLDELYALQDEQYKNINWTAFSGMMGKFFYKKINEEKIEITGFSLEDAAAHSYNKETNGGLKLIYPEVAGGRQVAGNMNYANPTTVFTKNISPPLDFTETRQQILTMFDYMEAAAYDLSGALLNAPSNPWDLSGEIKVTQVLGATQVGPYQCIMEWDENVIDPKTNQPYAGKVGIRRLALITYRKNEVDWFANDTIFDATGFMFLTTAALPACVFRPEDHRYAYADMVGKSDADVEAYFKGAGLRDGRSPCPTTNPGARFDADLYTAANPGVTATGTDAVLAYYKGTGLGAKQPVIAARELLRYTQPREIPYVLPADYGLDTGGDTCPPTNCSNPDILASLVKQYNEAPDMSGNILRVIKATTPSPYQCDLEVWMDMVSKEKGIQIPAGGAGQFQKKLSMYVGLDKRTCDFNLGGISSDKDPSTVIPQTPSLAKPLDYGERMREEQAGAIQYAFDSLGSLATGAFNAVKSYLKEYRLSTYAAVGDLATLDGCPQRKCSDPYLMDAFIRKYEDNNWQQSRIKQILRSGTYDGLTCDYTYEIEPVGLTPEGRPTTLPVVTTRGSRVKLQKESGTGCAFRVVSEEPVYPSPSWSQISDLTNTQFDRSNEFDTAALNYVNRRAIRYVDCRGANAMNQIVKFDQDVTKINAIKNVFINQCLADVQKPNVPTMQMIYTFDIDERNYYNIVPYLEGQLLYNRQESTPPAFNCPPAGPEVYVITNTTGENLNQKGLYVNEVCREYGGTLATYEQLVDAFNKGANWENGPAGLCADGKFYRPAYRQYRTTPQYGLLEEMNTSSTNSTNLGVLCYGIKKARGVDAKIATPFNENFWSSQESETYTDSAQKNYCLRKCIKPGYEPDALNCKVVQKEYAAAAADQASATGGVIKTTLENADNTTVYFTVGQTNKAMKVGFKRTGEFITDPNSPTITGLNYSNLPIFNTTDYRFDIAADGTFKIIIENNNITVYTSINGIKSNLDFKKQYVAWPKLTMQNNKYTAGTTFFMKRYKQTNTKSNYIFSATNLYSITTQYLVEFGYIDSNNTETVIFSYGYHIQDTTYFNNSIVLSYLGEYTIYMKKNTYTQDTHPLNAQFYFSSDSIATTGVNDFQNIKYVRTVPDFTPTSREIPLVYRCTGVNSDGAPDSLFISERYGNKCYKKCPADQFEFGFVCASKAIDMKTLSLTGSATATNITVSYNALLPETMLSVTTCPAVQSVNCSGPDGAIDPVEGIVFYNKRVYELEQVDRGTCKAKVLNSVDDKTAPTYGDVWKYLRFYQEYDCSIKLKSVDAIPCTNQLSCTVPDLVRETGTEFNGVVVYDSRKLDANTCEVRVLSDADAARANSYTDIYKRMRFEQDIRDCSFVYKGLTPAPCTKSVNCFIGDLDRVAGADFYGRRVYRSEQVDQNTCRLKVMSDVDVAKSTTTTFGQTTELVRFRTNNTTCAIEEVAKAPAQCVEPPFSLPATWPVAGVDLYGVRVYDAKQIGPMIVEARVLNYADAANSFVYGDIYKIIRFKYDKSCNIVEDVRYVSQNSDKINLTTAITTKPPIVQELSAVQPDIRSASVPADGKFKTEFDTRFKYNTGTPALMKKMMELTRKYIEKNKLDWVLGRFNGFAKDAAEGFIYKVTLAMKYETQYVYSWSDAYIRVVFRRGAVVTEDPLVESVVLLSGAPGWWKDSALTTANTPVPNDALPTTTPTYASKYTGTTGEYAKMHNYSISDASIRASLIGVLRAYIAADSTKLLGKIISYVENASTNSTILFKANYAELDADGFYTVYYPETAPAILEVTFKFSNGPAAPAVVTLITIKNASTGTFKLMPATDASDAAAAGTALPTSQANITKFNQIQFAIASTRSSTLRMLSLFRFQIFKDGQPVDPSTYTVRDRFGNVIVNADPASWQQDPTVYKQEVGNLTASAPFVLTITPVSPARFIDADGFSFIGGNNVDLYPRTWYIIATANSSGYQRVLYGTSTNAVPKKVALADGVFGVGAEATYPTGVSVFYRYPLTYLTPVTGSAPTATSLTAITDRPYTLADCGIAVNDIRLIRYASQLIFDELSKDLPGYSANEGFRNRYYLKGVLNVFVTTVDDNTQVVYNPILQRVDTTYKITDEPQYTTANSATYPAVRLVFKLRSNCSPVPIFGDGLTGIVKGLIPSLGLGLGYRFGSTLANKQTADTDPFGWGGITITALTGYTKLAGREITNIGSLIFTTYIENKTGDQKSVNVSQTGAYTLADGGAAMVCSSTEACLGFIQQVANSTAGFFPGVPRADSRLVANADRNLFIKNGFAIFTKLQIIIGDAQNYESSGQGSISIKNIKFYANSTEVPIGLQVTNTSQSGKTWDYYNTNAVAFRTITRPVYGSIGSMEGPELNTFISSGLSTTIAGFTTRQIILLTFQNPVIANKYSIVTNTSNPNNDIKSWVVQYTCNNTLGVGSSTTGSTEPLTDWITWHNMIDNTNQIASERRAEVIFTPGPAGAVGTSQKILYTPPPNTLESCEKTGLDILFVREMARAVYELHSPKVWGTVFNASERYINRCFLRGITAQRVDHLVGNNFVMWSKPTIEKVDATGAVSAVADDGALLFIKIYFSIGADCTLQIDTARTILVSRYGWVGLNTSSAQSDIPLTEVARQPIFAADVAPFGWGGLPAPPPIKITGYGLSSPQTFNVTQTYYIENNAGEVMSGRQMASSRQVPLNEMLLSRISDTDVIGYEYDDTTAPGTATFFKVSPIPRPIANAAKSLYILSPNAQVFKRVLFTFNTVRGVSKSPTLSIGKIIFYLNNAIVSSNIKYKVSVNPVDTSLDTMNTCKYILDLTNRRGFTYSLSTLSSTAINVSMTIEFETPILADSYSLVTGLETTAADPIAWTIRIGETTASTYKLWEQKTNMTPPETRLTEFYRSGGSSTPYYATQENPTLKALFDNKTPFPNINIADASLMRIFSKLIYDNPQLIGQNGSRTFVNRPLLANFIGSGKFIAAEYTETTLDFILNPDIYTYTDQNTLNTTQNLNSYLKVSFPLSEQKVADIRLETASISFIDINAINVSPTTQAFNEHASYYLRQFNNITTLINLPAPTTWDGASRYRFPNQTALRAFFYLPDATNVVNTTNAQGTPISTITKLVIKSFTGTLSPLTEEDITQFSLVLHNTVYTETIETSIVQTLNDNALTRIALGSENCIGYTRALVNNVNIYKLISINPYRVQDNTQNITFSRASSGKTFFLKNNYSLFNRITLNNIGTVGVNTSLITLGKIRFYLRGQLVVLPIQSSITYTVANTANTIGNLLDTTVSTAGLNVQRLSGSTLQNVTITFPSFVLADQYSFVTFGGTNASQSNDPKSWTITLSRVVGTEAAVTDYTATISNAQPPTERGVEYARTSFNPSVAAVSIENIRTRLGLPGSIEGMKSGSENFNIHLPTIQYIRFKPTALVAANRKGIRLGKLAFFGANGLITNIKGAAISTLNGTDRLFDYGAMPTAAAVLDYHSLESEWIDSGLGTLLIALPAPQQLTAFALLTGSDPGAAPAQWRLEGSEDGETWIPLHVQAGPATLPTTPFSQSLVYSFDGRQAPRRIPALFELSLAAAGKRCDDPSLLEAVHYEMATDATPRLFNPIAAAKSSGAMCEYRQADDTLVRVAFQTDLTGSSRVKALEVVGTPRQRTTSWEEEDFAGGRGQPTRSMVAPPRIQSPLEERGFGRGATQEISSLQEVFTLPLKQADGFVDVYSPQITQKQEVGTTVKYVRFRCTKTRGGTPVAGTPLASLSPACTLGSFALWARPGQQLELRRAKASNPMGKWAGTVEDLAENNSAARGFKDSAGTPLVIAFPEPVPVAGFSWKTPAAAGTESTDPVRWKLEGSANGTYWFTLHEQTRDYAIPMERGWRVPIFSFDGKPPLFR